MYAFVSSSPPLVQRTLRCILSSNHPPKASCFAAVQVHAIVICVTIRGARACFRRLHPPIFPQIDLASLAWSEAILLEMGLAILLRDFHHQSWTTYPWGMTMTIHIWLDYYIVLVFTVLSQSRQVDAQLILEKHNYHLAIPMMPIGCWWWWWWWWWGWGWGGGGEGGAGGGGDSYRQILKKNGLAK